MKEKGKEWPVHENLDKLTSIPTTQRYFLFYTLRWPLDFWHHSVHCFSGFYVRSYCVTYSHMDILFSFLFLVLFFVLYWISTDISGKLFLFFLTTHALFYIYRLDIISFYSVVECLQSPPIPLFLFFFSSSYYLSHLSPSSLFSCLFVPFLFSSFHIRFYHFVPRSLHLYLL